MVRKDIIYKYTELKYVGKVLKYGLHCSQCDQLNDPFEFVDIMNKEDYLICSMTRSFKAKLMWSIYGDSHKGCIVKIETPDEYLKENYVLRRVTYSSRFQNRDNLTPEAIVENLYIKDKKWSRELEVRTVFHKKSDKYKMFTVIDNDNQIYFKAKITQIVFGCESEHVAKEYEDALIAIKDYNDSKKYKKDRIIVQKMKISKNKFQIEYDKEFDYESVLKSLSNTNS